MSARLLPDEMVLAAARARYEAFSGARSWDDAIPEAQKQQRVLAVAALHAAGVPELLAIAMTAAKVADWWAGVAVPEGEESNLKAELFAALQMLRTRVEGNG